MTRFRKVLFIGLVCFLTLGVSYLYAGEGMPPGFELKGKTISATMVVISIDPADYQYGTMILVFGNCKKIPFQFVDYRNGNVYSGLSEGAFFDLDGNPTYYEDAFDMYNNPIISCDAPEDIRSWAITGFSSWVRNDDLGVIIAECFIEPLVPEKKTLP